MLPILTHEVLRDREREIQRNLRRAWQNEPTPKAHRTIRFRLPAVFRARRTRSSRSVSAG